MNRVGWILVFLALLPIGGAGWAQAQDYLEVWPQGWSEVQSFFAIGPLTNPFCVVHDEKGTSVLSSDGSYFREMDLVYREIDGEGVQEKIAVAVKKEIGYPILTLDAIGNRHLFWLEKEAGKNSFHSAQLTVPVGQFEDTIFWETANSVQDLVAVQVGKTTHLVWSERAPIFQIRYARLQAGALVEMSTITDSEDLSIRPVIAVDNNNTPYIAWMESTPVAVNVFFCYKEGAEWSRPIRVGEGSLQDIERGGSMAISARDEGVFLAWSAMPPKGAALCVYLARLEKPVVSFVKCLAEGSRPRFVEGEGPLQLVWQGLGPFGPQIRYGLYDHNQGALTERINLTVGRTTALRPEAVRKNGFVYVYWLQADSEQGYGIHGINNQYPKKISFWRRLGIDEKAPLIHLGFVIWNTFLLSGVYVLINFGAVLTSVLLFSVTQRWELFRGRSLFFRIMLVVVLLLLVRYLPIAAAPAFLGVIHYGMSLILAIAGTYFILRPVKQEGLILTVVVALVWLFLFQFFALLPQSIMV